MRFRPIALVAFAFATNFAVKAVAAEGDRAAMDAGKNAAAINIEDYPDQSLRDSEQGMSSVRYEINEQGRVTPGSCTVVMTSGYERLDVRTCVLAMRFRFSPALKNGKPVKEMREQSINWILTGHGNPKDQLNAALRVTRGSAQCAARERPKAAESIVLAQFAGEEQEAAFKAAVKANSSDCWRIGNTVKFPVWLFAGGAAEQLIVNKLGDLTKASIADAIAGSTSLPPQSNYDAFANCVMRRAPANALDFVGTYPGSPGELPVFEKIAPDLGPCLPAGQQLRLTKYTIRSLLMTALYREMVRLKLGAN